MNKSLHLVLTLTAFTGIAGATLAAFNMHTAPLISEYQSKARNKAAIDVLPGASDIEEQTFGVKTFFIGKNKNGNTTGIAFKTSGDGYQSQISLMVGTDAELTKLISVKILGQMETPGLGTKIEIDPSNKDNPEWFLSQFKEQPVTAPVTYIKDGEASKPGEIKAISGATISSKAVVNIVNRAIKENRKLLLKKDIISNVPHPLPVTTETEATAEVTN